jgi:N-acetylmuramoyl-L-alanine amidase
MRVGAPQGSSFRFAYLFGLLIVLSLCVPTSVAQAQKLEIQFDGQTYVDLATTGGRLGMKAYWLKGQQTFRLRSQWTNIDVGKSKRVLYLNRLPIYLGFPTLESSGRLYLAKADYLHVLQPILTPQSFSPKPGLSRIVIDAGHGGKDVGAKNDAYKLYEKDLTLDVARRLKSLLERAGFEVVMTRDSDVYIPLERRPQIANRERGDLFISIHFNAAGSSTAVGFETFALTPQHQASSKYPKPGRGDSIRYDGNEQDAWNTLFGYHVQRALVQRVGGPDRGLKRARFLVLKHLHCPGVLVELGFVSNPDTAHKLRTSSFRETLAQSLYDGIVQYSKRLQRIP